MAPTTRSMLECNTTSASSAPEKCNKRKRPEDSELDMPTPQKKERTVRKYSPTLHAWFNVYPPCLTRRAKPLEEPNPRHEETLPVRVPLPYTEASTPHLGRTALQESNERYEADLAAKRKAKDIAGVHQRIQEAAERWEQKRQEKALRIKRQPECGLCYEKFVERTLPLPSVEQYTCTNEKCNVLFCLGCKARHLKHDSRCPFCQVHIEGVEVRKPKWEWEDNFEDELDAEEDDASVEGDEEDEVDMEPSFFYSNRELREIRASLSEPPAWAQFSVAMRGRLERRRAPLRDDALEVGEATPAPLSPAGRVAGVSEDSDGETESDTEYEPEPDSEHEFEPESEVQPETEETGYDEYPSGELSEIARQALVQVPGQERSGPMVESRPQHRYARGHRQVPDAAQNLLDAVDEA